MEKPKKITSYRTCPNCGSRATKIYHLNDENKPYECQICGFRYDYNGDLK